MGGYKINDEEVPKGYRFVPNDEQLVSYYLHKKVNCEPMVPNVIREMSADDFYREPPSFYGDRARDERRFYFLLFDEPYFSGDFKKSRTVGNGIGRWKSDMYEVAIWDGNGKIIGYKNAFQYFPDDNDQTQQSLWTMKLYRLKTVSGYGKKEKWVLGRLVPHKHANSSYGTSSSSVFASGSSRAVLGRKEENKEDPANICDEEEMESRIIRT